MMAQRGNVKRSQAIEGELLPAAPSPRLRLATIRDCRRELAKVYIEARRGLLPATEAARLGWLLQTLVSVIRDSELEERISKLEAQQPNNTRQGRF